MNLSEAEISEHALIGEILISNNKSPADSVYESKQTCHLPNLGQSQPTVNVSNVNVENELTDDSEYDNAITSNVIMYKLRCSALNANGLHSKLDLGILDQYLAQFGISSVVETNTNFPDLSRTLLHNFQCFSKQLPEFNVKYSMGGFHGICIIVDPALITDAVIIEGMSSECVLWMKMKFRNLFEFIYGAVYVPCMTSKFYHTDAFLEIGNDVSDLNFRYNNLPTMIAGDINGHTGLSNDSLEGDDIVADITGCDMLSDSHMSKCSDLNEVFTDDRFSQDTQKVDKNGLGLTTFCKSHGYKIVNGRVGCDKFIGQRTCHKTESPSVIDYLVVSENMLPFITDFKVEMFDSNYSDVHSPIEFELKCDEIVPAEGINNDIITNATAHVMEAAASSSTTEIPSLKFRWSHEIAADFKVLSNLKLQELKEDLEKVTNSPAVKQNDIDLLCGKLNDLFVDSAKLSGAYTERKRQNDKKSNSNKNKPWMDQEFYSKRKEYYRVKNKLKRIGSKSMCNKESREFKKFVKLKKKNYHDQLNKKIRTLRSNNSKEYWDLLNRSTEAKAKNKLCLGTFMEHFKKLSQTDSTAECHLDSDIDDSDHESKILNICFEVDELSKLIRGLKNHKACGIDLLKNEFLKNASQDMVEFMCKFFNMILESGYVPDVWCKGFIMPMYKNKGTRKDPDNYRGITLLSCLGKLFTACLSARISNFMYDTNKMGVEQAGFRPGYSTMDHIFTLHCIIEQYKKKKNGRVYVAFVDYSKAFDLVERSSLWVKLLQNGIKGRIVNVIRNMYDNAKSCVKSGDSISEFFSCNVGVRQGENLSPVLFAIYLNDFSQAIGSSFDGLESLSVELQDEIDVFMKLYVLLYADDTIVLAESADQLQKALNKLDEYCKIWSLKINISKTKIVIFAKGKVRSFPKFYVGKDEIEVTNDYVYLGVTFHNDGSFKNAKLKQINQARKAMYGLLSKTRLLGLPVDIVIELFNVCIIPILLYGAEVWGFENIDEVEIFHRQFLRIILKSYKFTPKPMLYGETGVFDLRTLIDSRMVGFWARLRNCNKGKISSLMCCFTSNVNNKSDNDCNIRKFEWCKKIKCILECTGYSHVWDNPSLCDKLMKKQISIKLKDIFRDKWLQNLDSNSQCTIYKLFKHNHCLENYLTLLDAHHRITISNFRMRVHQLPITNARFYEDKDIAAKIDTKCKLCDTNSTGDEIHYLFYCPFFHNERSELFPNDIIGNSLLFKFSKWQLVFKEETGHLVKLALFLKKVMLKFARKSKCKTASKEQLEFKLTTQTTRLGRMSKPPARFVE